MSKPRRFLSLHEYADAIGRSYIQCHRDAKSGKIPIVRIGGRVYVPSEYLDRISQEALDRFDLSAAQAEAGADRSRLRDSLEAK